MIVPTLVVLAQYISDVRDDNQDLYKIAGLTQKPFPLPAI